MSVNNSLTKEQSAVMAQPQTGNAVSQSIQAKEQAKIQGQVFMAKQFPRNMSEVMNKVQSSCERPSLAKISEYEYARGGQKIVGASIRLLETVAQCYGNISWTWKEIIRDMDNHKSTVVASAWDLESNTYNELEFEVPHYRDKKSAADGKELVKSSRDIYELIASQSARRVRKCLEGVVPKDIVEQAREWCSDTLNSKVDIQDGINKAIKFFNDEYGIKENQIESYFGMGRRAFTSNTYLALQRIYVSVKDGMSQVDDYFPKEETTSKVKNKLAPEKPVNKDTNKNSEERPPLRTDLDGQPSLI